MRKSCTIDKSTSITQSSKWMEVIKSLEDIIDNLEESNFNESVALLLRLINDNFQYFPYLTISRFIYSSFLSHVKDFDVYIEFMIEIDNKNKNIIDENIKRNHKMINRFSYYLLPLKTQEAYYLLEKLVERNLIKKRIKEKIINGLPMYFAHYHKKHKDLLLYYRYPCGKTFVDNYEELSKNDWELHKKYVKEGHNPNEIAKIIRNDEIEKLQEISSQTNFDFNQTIEPSLYERYSFINNWNVTLIDYAAFFSSVKCFKYLLMNGAKVNNTGKYAIAGGNEEIIHLCEQNHSSFKGAYETAIEFHRNDIFKYLYENKITIYPSESFIILFSKK